MQQWVESYLAQLNWIFPWVQILSRQEFYQEFDEVCRAAVMEQSIGQDEQANKFSAEIRIRKTQVWLLGFVVVVTYKCI